MDCEGYSIQEKHLRGLKGPVRKNDTLTADKKEGSEMDFSSVAVGGKGVNRRRET